MVAILLSVLQGHFGENGKSIKKMCDTTYITVNQRYIQDKDGYDIMISRGGNRYKTVDKFYAYFLL